MKLDRQGVLFSIGVKQHKHMRELVEQIPETDWTAVTDYPAPGEAQIAETTLWGFRLVVRRVRTLGPQAQLFDTWQHFAFVTNRSEPIELVEAEHREHAVVELSIRDLKARRSRTSPPGSSPRTAPGA